jgi:hypothetical protein
VTLPQNRSGKGPLRYIQIRMIKPSLVWIKHTTMRQDLIGCPLSPGIDFTMLIHRESAPEIVVGRAEGEGLEPPHAGASSVISAYKAGPFRFWQPSTSGVAVEEQRGKSSAALYFWIAMMASVTINAILPLPQRRTSREAEDMASV